MQMNNSEKGRLHIHYSPNYSNSVGLVLKYFKDTHDSALSVQWNHLLSRKNTYHSQANLYSKVNLGVQDSGKNKTIGAIEIAGDWETRKIFSSFQIGALYRNDDWVVKQSARLGFAPYVAEYGSLHTWLMVKIESTDNDKPLTTAIARFFKGDVLVELGLTDKKNPEFNWVKRF